MSKIIFELYCNKSEKLINYKTIDDKHWRAISDLNTIIAVHLLAYFFSLFVLIARLDFIYEEINKVERKRILREPSISAVRRDPALLDADSSRQLGNYTWLTHLTWERTDSATT